MLSQEQAEDIARRAGIVAAEEVLLRIGIDTKDPRQRKQWMENMSFLDRMSSGAKLVKNTTIKTSIGAVIAGVIALIMLGTKGWIASLPFFAKIG